jgi:hypothetical protein
VGFEQCKPPVPQPKRVVAVACRVGELAFRSPGALAFSARYLLFPEMDLPRFVAGRRNTEEIDSAMADTIKHKVEEAGHKIAETATKVGHKVGEKFEEAADWAKEKAHQAGNRIEETTQKVEHKAKETFGSSAPSGTVADIREHMDVIGSCGTKLGRVDRVEGSSIKLTMNDSPDGQHHLIPTSWVTRVDSQVHLSKNCGEAQREWQPA